MLALLGLPQKVTVGQTISKYVNHHSIPIPLLDSESHTMSTHPPLYNNAYHGSASLGGDNGVSTLKQYFHSSESFR